MTGAQTMDLGDGAWGAWIDRVQAAVVAAAATVAAMGLKWGLAKRKAKTEIADQIAAGLARALEIHEARATAYEQRAARLETRVEELWQEKMADMAALTASTASLMDCNRQRLRDTYANSAQIVGLRSRIRVLEGKPGLTDEEIDAEIVGRLTILKNQGGNR